MKPEGSTAGFSTSLASGGFSINFVELDLSGILSPDESGTGVTLFDIVWPPLAQVLSISANPCPNGPKTLSIAKENNAPEAHIIDSLLEVHPRDLRDLLQGVLRR